MRKQIIKVLTLFVAGALSFGNALAQQTSQAPSVPPAKTQSGSAPKAPAASAPKAHPTPTTQSSTVPALKTPRDKTSYAIGVNIGRGMRSDSLDVDPNLLLRGIKDALAGTKPLMTDDEMKSALTALQGDLRQRQMERMQQVGETNKKEAEAFLSANKTKPGVVALPSGLQYKILKEGSVPKPTTGDSVVCNYRGVLLNNTEFDSSYKRGQPATFGVGQVIKGWTEALQLMPVGSRWQLFIPSELAYGQHGAGPDIGPNATLIFEVELLSIVGKNK